MAPYKQLHCEQMSFSWALTEYTESAKRITGGRLFQHRGPAAEKARSSKCTFILRTRRSASQVIAVVARTRRNELQCSNLANTREQLHAVIERRIDRACTRRGM